MEQETLYNILTGRYGEILETHAMWECISALGIKPFKDGNQWCFLYGNNIQDGICGFGKTISEAAWDFYINIKTEGIRNDIPNERKIGDWVITTKMHESLNGIFTKGSKAKIVGIDPVRGYDIEDEHGNKMYEIGWEI